MELCWLDTSNPTSEKDRGIQISKLKSHAAKHHFRKGRNNKLKSLSQSRQNQQSLTASSSSTSNDNATGRQYKEYMKQFRSDRPGASSGFPLLASQHQNNLLPLFRTDEDLQSFQFWISKTAPTIVMYGSSADEFSTRLISQLVLSSTTIRELIIAHGCLHESFASEPSNAQQLMTQASLHYARGLRELSKLGMSVEFIAATLIGVYYEAFRRDSRATRIHLKGFESALSNYKGPRNGSFKMLESSLAPVTGLLSVALYETNSETEDTEASPAYTSWSSGQKFHTLPEARAIITEIVDRISADSDHSEASVHEIKISLSNWFDTICEWEIKSMWPDNRPTLLLLFHFTKTLLPQSNAKPSHLYHFLQKAEQHLAQSHGLEAQNRSELLLTLQVLARHLSTHRVLSELNSTQLRMWRDRLGQMQQKIDADLAHV